jgi:hypothetical protein
MIEGTKRHGEDMLENISKMRELRRQQEKCFDELELWARLMLQGIEPSNVKALGYDPLKDKRRHCDQNTVAVYNKVTLKDGEVVWLDPALPVPPKERTPAPTLELKVNVDGRRYTVRYRDSNTFPVLAIACEGHWPMMEMTPAIPSVAT